MVTVKGTGNDPSVFEIDDACPTDDAQFCFGSTRFEEIDIKKTNKESYPKRAVLIGTLGWSNADEPQIERAILSYSQGTIEGFAKGGIESLGKVDLIIDNAVFTNIGTSGQEYPVIWMIKGGEAEAETGFETDSNSPLTSPCNFSENGYLNIANSVFSNNKGRRGIAVYAQNAQVILDSVSIYENEGMSLIQADCSDITMINSSTLHTNNVTQMIYVEEDSALHFSDSEASDNTGAYYGTFITSHGYVEITNSTIYNNSAANNGGGVYFIEGTLTSSNSCWNQNSPDDVYHVDLSTSYFFDCNDFTCDETGCY